MQTSKSKANPIEAPLRSSPKTPRATREIKTPGSGSEQVSSSPNKANRANKDRSPKVIERRTTHSPISEKKRQTKEFDLESKMVQLQEDLKQARDKMISSDLLKEQAELEAEDAKKQLSAMTAKLEDAEKQLTEISKKEICKTSQDRDTMLESEHEVTQKQHSLDSSLQVNPADDIHILRSEHEKVVSMNKKLNDELGECKNYEAKLLEKLNDIQSQLKAAMEENETLKLGGSNAFDYNNSVASELEESKAKVKALEIIVSKPQSSVITCSDGLICKNDLSAQENEQNEETKQLKSEIMNLKYEENKLRAALETAEMKCKERVESADSHMTSKEAELQKAHSDIKELQAKLSEKELLNDSDRDQRKQLEIRFTTLQETLLQKDILLQDMEKENGNLKQELQTLEIQMREMTDGSAADYLVEAEAVEQKVTSNFEYLTEESDKNSKKTPRVIEQLDAAQAANAELESELRKLKVQSDQWRKAAEAAAAMLTSGNNGKYIDRTGSLDSGYHTLGGRISSPFSDDLNDDAVKKKNGNMLKKIGVLWKKGQNQK